MRKFSLFLACFLLVAWAAAAEPTVKETVDAIADRLRAALNEDELLALDAATLERFVTPEDKAVLGSRHWCFDVDVPVVVYVMRETGQQVAPFWLAERDFELTPLTIQSNTANMNFEIWRKQFPAGRVGLGINGFDRHRPHYFVAVKPQQAGQTVRISNPHPEWQQAHELRPGAFYYHDWTELGVANVPEEMEGSLVLPTIRGRAREAHFIGGFRTTEHVSSITPDQIVLTPPDETPATSMAVQWRTAPSVTDGAARFREKTDGSQWTTVDAASRQTEDLLIINDAGAKFWTAVMTGLQPGTQYEYEVSNGERNWTHRSSFTTAPDAGEPFTFAFLSDTHNRPDMEGLLDKATELYPDIAFVTISGDIVGTGQYRDDWDEFLHHGRGHFDRLPVAPSIGNHDGIDGLGVDLYLAQFELPQNGPDGLEPQRTYSFTYGNALFLSLDVVSPVSAQTAWLDAQLAESTADWTFAVFHFPAYSPGDYNQGVLTEWAPVFDKHGLDFALSGHVHYYVRTHPIKNGEVQDSPDDGTIYVVTVSVPSRDRPVRTHPRAAAMGSGGNALVNVFTVDGNRVTMTAIDADGNVHDEFEVTK